MGSIVSDLAAALQALELDWQTAQDSWRDEVGRSFEREHLTPLLLQGRATLAALEGLDRVIDQARRQIR